MSNISWAIYFIGIGDTLQGVFLFCSIFSAVAVFIAFICMITQSEYNDEEANKKPFYFCLCCLACSLLLLGITPNSKTLTAMLVAPSIVNNKEAQKLPDNVLRAINSKLEKIANE